MRVAILYSGGKDSTFALYEALKRGWEVVALIAVKPKNTETYLWHYATVEWTLLSSTALNIPLFLIKCDKIGAKEEAEDLERVLKLIKIDALLLGGVGLQKTQIREIRNIAKKYKIKVVVPYEGMDEYETLKNIVKSGFDVLITQVASAGLGPEWLGKKLDLENLKKLKELSEKYGFNLLGEGGSYDTFVVDGPIFKKKINLEDVSKVWDEKTSSGYLEVRNATLVEKG